MSQILINNADYHTTRDKIEFLESLRDEGVYKYEFKFRVYLN